VRILDLVPNSWRLPISLIRSGGRQIQLKLSITPAHGTSPTDRSVSLGLLPAFQFRLHTFVPGLPLSLLDHRLVEGNALVGIATIPDAKTKLTAISIVALRVEPAEMLMEADPHLRRLARISDATPQDVVDARSAYLEARKAVAPISSLFDAAVAFASGHDKLRLPVNMAIAHLDKSGQSLDLRGTKVHADVLDALAPTKWLHLPTAFPEVFRRSNPGFDVIIGNPPWEKLRVEKHEFWARHFPGLRGIKDAEKRDAEIRRLSKARPDLVQVEEAERIESEALRDAMRALPGMNTGHPDLFRAFMARFAQLLTQEGGRYGVVLPGDAFKVKGNGPVREDLDRRATNVDVQMLTNRSEWVFKDVHGQKVIALVVVKLGQQDSTECTYVFRPEHHREEQFRARRLNDFAERSSHWLRTYSSGLVQPTLPTAEASASIAVVDTMLLSPPIATHPKFAVRRVYADVETSRKYKEYYKVKGTERGLWPVYGGDSFEIWQPDTGQYYAQARGADIFKLVQEKRANVRRGTPYFDTSEKWRSDPKTHPVRHPRIAYRDITNRTNTRTLIASLIPPDRVLTQSAPWVLWTDPRHPLTHEAFVLGIMSSICADWWMRRFVEGHVDEEAFNSLPVPDTDPARGLGLKVVSLAGRLACPDDRFRTWANAVNVECGPLRSERKETMIEELDAVVACLYGLSAQQLTHIFDSFHEWPTDRERTVWSARRDRTLTILGSLT
jgi:hypothetical protein